MDPELKDFVKTVDICYQQPINPRDSLYGGRTNAVKLYHKCGPGEQINYTDICSLYPWVCKYREFPVGHPDVITRDFSQVSAYNGVIKCKILPPKKLLHPVLPYQSKKKLTFPLCKVCADERNQQFCYHSESAFWKTWITLELNKAIDLDYQVMEISEVWHYPQTFKYNGTDPDSGIFTQYIDKFLKLKQEKSDWPKWVLDSEDVEAAKLDYMEQYEEKEGIKLDPTNIEKNEAFCQLAKLMLNSFWGKFGQRDNLPVIKYMTEPTAYIELVGDPGNIVSNVQHVGDNMVAVEYTKEDEFIEVLGNSNPAVAAYTTTQARLKLYSYIEELQERILYFDTDSDVPDKAWRCLQHCIWRLPWRYDK